MRQIVVDTSVFVAALIGRTGASREVLRRCLGGRYRPCISLALFAEYRDLLGRVDLFRKSPLNAGERLELFNALMAKSRLVDVYFLWRPNLPDEGDNHVLELAVAARVEAIVTRNRTDFLRAELNFPGVRIVTPAELLKEN